MRNWTMRDSGLYTPSGAYGPNTGLAHLATSGFGAYVGSEHIPGGISFPKEGDYAKGLIDAVSETAPAALKAFDHGGEFNPPFMGEVATLKATLEATTGIKLSQLYGLAQNVAALTQATDPVTIGAAVSNLMQGVLDVVVSGLKAAGAAADAVATVPILGSLVGMIASGVLDVIASQARVQQAGKDCQGRVERDREAFCKKLLSDAQPQKTDADGVQPADLFRPVMYAMQKGGHLPLTAVSLYVALCGGETQGAFGLFSRAEWRKLLDGYHKQTGRKYIGVPIETQRRMWALCKGIMSATQDPRIGTLFAPGDNGKALMPILQDITRNLWLVGNGLKPRRGEYGIDESFLNLLSSTIANKYYKYIECPDLIAGESGAGAMPAGGESCLPFVNLANPFIGAIRDFELQLKKVGLLNPDLSWNTKPAEKRYLDRGPPLGVLVIKGSTAKELEATAEAARAAAEGGRAASHKAATWTTAVVLGGGSLMLARRAAKKRR